MHRREELAGRAIEFNLRYGDWIRLFRSTVWVEALVEVRPPEGAESSYRTAEETEWARDWPMEEIWGGAAKPVSVSAPPAMPLLLDSQASYPMCAAVTRVTLRCQTPF